MANNETEAKQTSFVAHDLCDTGVIGERIAAQLVFPSCVYLRGAMGAGKTTLTKSIIQAFGYKGEVTPALPIIWFKSIKSSRALSIIWIYIA